MNKSPTPQPKKKPIDGEALTAICLLALTVFLILTVSILIFQSCSSGDATPEEGSTTKPQGNSGVNSSPDSTPPVFSDGVLPSKPFFSENSQTVSLSTTSQYIVLTNSSSGEIVASLNSDARFSPASMTKVMTLIVMCERLTRDDLKQTVTFTSEMYDYARSGNYIGSTNYGIDPRDEYKVEDLLYGIGMYSASDCVLSVLLYLNVTEEQFVVWMNEKVEQLQLTNTHFDNPIGYESTENYTTAQDMAQIMAYAMQNDLIRSFLSKEVHISTASGYNSKGEYVPTFPISFYSTLFGMHENSRMYSYEKNYGTPFQLQTAKLLAGKTGYLENDGVKNHCLVVYAKDSDSDAHYILVVGGGTQPQYVTMKDIKNILDAYVP